MKEKNVVLARKTSVNFVNWLNGNGVVVKDLFLVQSDVSKWRLRFRGKKKRLEKAVL